jgi:hypothetical protein
VFVEPDLLQWPEVWAATGAVVAHVHRSQAG